MKEAGLKTYVCDSIDMIFLTWEVLLGERKEERGRKKRERKTGKDLPASSEK